MQISKTNFNGLISSNRQQFIIPIFQRNYCWEQKQWNTFWGDIITLFNHNTKAEHYFGTFVTKSVDIQPTGVQKWMLIDGQQRLTTVTLFITAIRDILKKKNEIGSEKIEEIDNTFLKNQYKKDTNQYKLLPAIADRKTYYNIIEGNVEDCNKDELLLYQAYNFFKKKLLEYKEISELEKIIERVIDNLVIVNLSLDNHENEYLIFESINSKALPLTQADLIRNYFIMNLPVDKQEEVYNKKWKPMEEMLSDSMPDFLRHFLMMKGTTVKKSDVYLELKSRIEKSQDINVLEYIDTIHKYSRYYNRLINPLSETNQKIQTQLEDLLKIEMTTSYPFLLSILNRYEEKEINENELLEVLNSLEAFHIKRFICQTPTNDLNKFFPSLYSKIKDAPNLIEALKSKLKMQRFPDEQTFRECFISNAFYGTGNQGGKKLKFILEKIEESFEHKEKVSLEDCSIEHIMPQTLTKWWIEHLGSNHSTIFERYLNTIGNLTLTKYNSNLSNKPFSEKKKLLNDSHIELNKYFNNIDRWDEDAIKNRSNILSDIGLKIWKDLVKDTSLETIAQNDDVTGKKPVAFYFSGERFSVKHWYEVLAKFFENMQYLDNVKFSKVIGDFKNYISKDQSELRSAVEIYGGYYVEKNLSASHIQRIIHNFIECFGDEEIEYKIDCET